jgi:Ca2+-binding RTX toxin-like protein
MLWGDDNANVLIGLGDDDSLKGYGGADRLWGGDGHDTLNGMDGNDTLRGESGEFVVGTAALDANDRIIYDSNSGALYYDGDGIGGTAAIQFAEVNPGLGLTHLDFFVV